MANVPEEYQEAMELFESYLNGTDHEERNDDFQNAFEILNDFLEDNPESSYAHLFKSLKVKYIHKFLGELPNLHHLDIDDWAFYFLSAIKCAEDFSEEINLFPHLKDNYEHFREIWQDEALKIFLKK